MWNDFNYWEDRKPTKKQLLISKLNDIKNILFMQHVDRSDNGVCGSGYHNYSYYTISYGKIATILVIILGIVVFIKM